MIQAEVAVVCTASKGLRHAQAGRAVGGSCLGLNTYIRTYRRATLGGHVGPEDEI